MRNLILIIILFTFSVSLFADFPANQVRLFDGTVIEGTVSIIERTFRQDLLKVNDLEMAIDSVKSYSLNDSYFLRNRPHSTFAELVEDKRIKIYNDIVYNVKSGSSTVKVVSTNYDSLYSMSYSYLKKVTFDNPKCIESLNMSKNYEYAFAGSLVFMTGFLAISLSTLTKKDAEGKSKFKPAFMVGAGISGLASRLFYSLRTSELTKTIEIYNE